MNDTFASLPRAAHEVLGWTWGQYEPYFHDLEARALNVDSVARWLADWTHLTELLDEARTRLSVASSQDTTDKAAEQAYLTFLQDIAEPSEAAHQKLKEKLLASGLQPEGFEIPLRNMRAEAEIFREANLPLLTEHRKVATQYDKIVGAQTVAWEGEERPLPQMLPVFENPDRATRERAWWRVRERQLADRDALNAVWRELLPLRRQMAANADCADYREFVWQAYQRFDYTPADCETFHAAIEAVVVPAG